MFEDFITSAYAVAGVSGIAGVAGGVIVYWLSKQFMTKWLDARFAEKLEKSKFEQQQQLKRAEYRINKLIDRYMKIYAKEYTHLPELWFLTNNAYQAARSINAGHSLDILDGMSPERLELAMAEMKFSDLVKHDIKASENKTNAYANAVRHYVYQHSYEEHSELYIALGKYGIYLGQELKDKFEEIRLVIWNAIIEYEVYSLKFDFRDGVPIRAARDVLRETGEAKMKDLERMIHERLWDAERAVL